VRHRGTLVDVTIEEMGTVPLFGAPARFEKTPARIDTPPPRLSADTRDVLAGIGVQEDELAGLKARGVI
jgi:crotonobetainyl-CoA:carnitine CoA-transferase CaiB-like acyl-CoA transferase